MAIEIKEYEGHVAQQIEDNKKAGDKSPTKKPAKKQKRKSSPAKEGAIWQEEDVLLYENQLTV